MTAVNDHCKSCGGCKTCDRCSHCGKCRNCGKAVASNYYYVPITYPEPYQPYVNPWPPYTTTIRTTQNVPITSGMIYPKISQ